MVKFPVESLVSRRTFVFARAGFGKSNLNKLLFSKLYETTPTVEKRGGRDGPGRHDHLRSGRRVLLAGRQGPSWAVRRA